MKKTLENDTTYRIFAYLCSANNRDGKNLAIGFILKLMDILPRNPFAPNGVVFRRLEETSNLTDLSREERMKYDTAIRQYCDTLNMFKDEKKRGRAEGRVEAMLSVVRNMKAAGLGVGVIQQVTGLPPEVIDRME